MNRYWISWWQPGDDPRPLHFPPKDARVLGWWETGTDGERNSICAVVAASAEWTAKAAVAEDWPESVDAEWRFVEVKPADWEPESSRFKVDHWMTPRFTAGVASVATGPVVGSSGSDWEAVGGFRFDQHAGWQQVAAEYANDSDVTTLYRKRNAGVALPDGTER